MIEYDTWVHDEWADLEIPSGDPAAVGELIGEMLWCLYLEVTEAGAPAIDYEQALQPKQDFASTGGHTPRGLVAAGRLRTLKALVERALRPLNAAEELAWCRCRLSRTWSDESNAWECSSHKKVARALGRDKKTIARWVAAGDEAVCAELDKLGWSL